VVQLALLIYPRGYLFPAHKLFEHAKGLGEKMPSDRLGLKTDLPTFGVLMNNPAMRARITGGMKLTLIHPIGIVGYGLRFPSLPPTRRRSGVDYWEVEDGVRFEPSAVGQVNITPSGKGPRNR